MAHITFDAIKASNNLAEEEEFSFTIRDLNSSEIIKQQSAYLDKLTPLLEKHFHPEEVADLKHRVETFGLWILYLQAIPPSGSISYITNSTPSIHPIVDPVEIRKEGKIGRIHSPDFGLPQWMEKTGNQPVETAYSLGWKPIIDMYAVALPYVDQASSLTLFFKEGITTRDINKAQIYAWKKGIKSLYYTRIRQTELTSRKQAVEAPEECVACAL